MNKVAVNIDPDFHGPTIIEMAVLLPLEKAEFAWKDTRAEIELFRDQPDGDYTLVVPNAAAAIAAAQRLGVRCQLPVDLIKKGVMALNTPTGRWREFAEKQGPAVARSALLKAHLNNVKRGKLMGPLQKLLVESVLHGRSISDADALLGLRLRGGGIK